MPDMIAASDRLEFAPPTPPGFGRALLLALMAHLLLVAALTWGVHWKSQPVTLSAEAELWSAVPKEAAPQRIDTAPEQQPVPEPAPEKVTPPAPPPAPPPPRPKPEPETPKVSEADIALEKEKLLLKKVEEKKLLQEKQRQDKLKREKLAEEKELLEKKALDKKLAEKKLQDKREQEKKVAEEKKAAEEKKVAEAKKQVEAKKLAEEKLDKKLKAQELERKAALDAKEDAKRMETQRQANLKRMAGLAGATGSASATGKDLQSSGPSGPSSGYAGRIRARIKPNIVFTEDISTNPVAEVDVVTSPDGTIISRKIVKSSGLASWDEAVLRAIDKTETLPRDTNGRVPSPLTLIFRPKD